MGLGTGSLLEIIGIVGDSHVLTEPEDLICYSYDASRIQVRPACVAFPASAREVSEILRLACREGFAVIPRGAGSGMVGASVPSQGGLVLGMNRLDRILEIDPDEMLAVVQPGVVTGALQRAVAEYGLFYPPDPASASFSTLGGNVAMGSGGLRAVKYGVTRDYVLGLEVVLPTGSVIRTGTRTSKGVVGYDMTRLMVGSEGTLGIFSEIVLRLAAAPETRRTLLVHYPSLDQATDTVRAILRNRVVPSALELMDHSAIEVVESTMSLGLDRGAEALLLIEVDGWESAVTHEAALIASLCRASGASSVQTAATPAECDALWKGRKAISPALGQIRPHKINEDITVPRTRITRLIRSIREIAHRHDLIIVCFGHAGDGNIHTNIMLDRSNRDELARAEKAVEEIFRIVLELGGTLSGEHGVGIAKSPYLLWEVGQDGFDAMWRIKQALDPRNILNPGKMFSPSRAFFSPA
ncbi:MAG: FAD-binding protein [Syntrophobacteraceae bacterium]|jgi:glycolate oxidase|nr:FAD-binding protein [Syntrophobacteraceae bacterium]